MRFDNLAKPISEAEPCGPDLDELGDDKYLNYMLGAENRLPTRYMDFKDSPDGVPFDGSKIDLKAEMAAISGFLEESRDLRLLTLEARFQALSGSIQGFSECVQAIALLIAAYWNELHPRGMDDDFTLRQNAVGALDARATVVAALEYAPVLRDQRVGSITLRTLAIAKGTATPRESERSLDMNLLTETLRSPTHHEALNAMHASIAACQNAVKAIQSAFDEATNYAFSPDFDLLRGVLAQLRGLIELGRTDLAGATSQGADPDAAEEPAGAEPGVAISGSAGQPRQQAAPSSGPVKGVDIPNRPSAAAALLAAEQYFGRHEASSPALILVHQARMLVGQPLVAALEALLPENAESAAMIVDPAFGFQFSLAKMKAITDDYSSTAEEFEYDPETILSFDAQNRQDAIGLIIGVSAFFRQSEPSSPIPMLLGKAERFMSQSFQAILSDLMPKTTSS